MCRRTAAALFVLTAILAGPTRALDDFIAGRVTNADGTPEAGVWVIAETRDLETPYRKIVVTGEDGRFVVPELPEAVYALWVRGYGLADSGRTTAAPGDELQLSVEAAADAVAAAAIYPANHWLSLLEPPDGDAGWASTMKLSCQLCHQLGSTATRYRTRAGFDLGLRKSSFMHASADALGRDRLLDALADWSRRLMDGATPPAPARPSGVERNLVITQWEWGDEFTYAHDEIATDKRDPTRYPDAPVYGVDLANDRILALDPVAHRATTADVPTVDGFDTPWCAQTWRPASGEGDDGDGTGDGDGGIVPMGFGSLGCPVRPGITPFEGAYDNPANPHNPMLDAQGRVWITTQIRREWEADLPAFCDRETGIEGAYHHRQLGWYDPEADAFELIDTCYGTHHLQFDAEGVLWTSGDTEVIGWFDPAKYDPDDPATLADAQGWARVVVDADADGEADTPIRGFNYGVIPNPVDGSVWTAQPGGNPGEPHDYRGRLVRHDPAKGTFETFVPPAPGAGPRGVDVDSAGIVWASLGGSGHLARFDRSRCAETRGSGDQCPEGWTLYRSPGPVMDVTTETGALGADFHYYLFVDRFGTLGLGEDVVILNGTGSDSLLAFRPETRDFVTIRIPYPLNTFTRGLDGRIDDPDGGWKGRGLWFTNGLDPIHHSEIGRSFVGKVQLRPDPLAR